MTKSDIIAQLQQAGLSQEMKDKITAKVDQYPDKLSAENEQDFAKYLIELQSQEDDIADSLNQLANSLDTMADDLTTACDDAVDDSIAATYSRLKTAQTQIDELTAS